MLYTLNLYSAVCELYLNKTRRRRKKKKKRPGITFKTTKKGTELLPGGKSVRDVQSANHHVLEMKTELYY